MPALVVDDAAILRLGWTIGTEAAFNVLGVRCVGGIPLGDDEADAFANVVQLAFAAAAFRAVIDVQTRLDFVGIRDIREPNAAELVGTFTPTAGTASGNQLGHEVALCVTLRTAKAGRRFRGRVYLPVNGATSLTEEDARYTTASVDAGRHFVEDIQLGIENSPTLGGNFHLAVVSRPDATVSPAWPGEANDVTGIVVRSPVKTTQRRRLPRRG